MLVPLLAPAETLSPDILFAEWVAHLGSEDPAKQEAAYKALLKAGPRAKSAVPALVKALRAKNVPTSDVVDVLGAIGPAANEAVPALLALLPKDGDLGPGADRIAVAVAKIDGPKVEATRALLLTYTKSERICLIGSHALREYPAQVIPHLVEFCGDKDAQVRMKTATVLGTLKEKEPVEPPEHALLEKAGDAAKWVAPALAKLLEDENADVRLAAAGATCTIAPELVDRALRVVVAMALDAAEKKKDLPRAWEIFLPVPQQATKVLLPLLDHPNDRVRSWAISGLTSLPVREPIEDALKNGKTTRIRQAAAMTLGGRFHSALESAPALQGALKDGEFIVRFAAAEALVYVGSRGSQWYAAAVPVLIEGLQHKEEQVRFAASHKLMMTGPVAKKAVPALKNLLGDPKPAVRIEAALALVGIDVKEATGTVPALIEGLKADEHPAIEAAEALAELGPVAKGALPELVNRFDAKSPHLRLYAAEAAARIDPAQAAKAVEVLVGLLQNEKYKSSMIRSYSLGALQRIGPAAKSALPALAELLTDDGPFHEDVAVAMIAIDPDGAEPAFEWIRDVLGKKARNGDLDELAVRISTLGPRAKILIPQMTELLKSDTPDHRENAVIVLAAIGPAAKATLPDLKKLARSDPQEKIRALAADAIKKIEAK
jgi:HEAT repeat protein